VYDIVPNGIELEAFRRPCVRPPAMETGRRHVLFVGRIEPRKGLEHLIRAMSLMHSRGIDAPLVVVGEGPDVGRLEALARELRVSVRFVGRVADEDLAPYFHASDIVCAPATGGESFGLVLLEAMACGKPIVASDIEGFAELVGDSGCGVLVPPGDAPALAAALTDMLSDNARRHDLGARGAARAAEYDWRRIAARLESIYSRLVATAPSAAAAR